MKETYDPIPETCEEALAKWDAGESVFTVKMGGLGPGYEQAIQALVFEIVRDYLGKPLPGPDTMAGDKWGDDTVHRVDALLGGLSGAQVGAAKSVAYRGLRDGWRTMVRSAPSDRQIQVSRVWPNVPLTVPRGR